MDSFELLGKAKLNTLTDLCITITYECGYIRTIKDGYGQFLIHNFICMIGTVK